MLWALGVVFGGSFWEGLVFIFLFSADDGFLLFVLCGFNMF